MVLRLGLRHLNEHKFNHNFRDCVNPSCPCNLEVEAPSHFFLPFNYYICNYYIIICKTLFHELQSVDGDILNQSDKGIVELLLYSSKKFKFRQNCSILMSAIRLIIKSEISNGSVLL